MQKPNALRITLLFSALLCIIKLALDIFIILNNNLSLKNAAIGNYMAEDPLPTEIKSILITAAFIAALPIGILSAVNYLRTDMDRKRGILNIAAAGAFFLVNVLCNFITDHFIISITEDKFAVLTSAADTTRNVSELLLFAATIMFCCCASVEIYGGITQNKNLSAG